MSCSALRRIQGTAGDEDPPEDATPPGGDNGGGPSKGGAARHVAKSDKSDTDFVLGKWHEGPRVDSSLSSVSEALDACDVGSRKAAKLLSEYSVAKGDAPLSRSRIQRSLEKKTRKEKIRGVGASASACSAVFCDSRNDKSRCGTMGNSIETVRNITVNMHPGGVFIGHFSCSGWHTGKAVAEQLLGFLSERGVDVTTVTTIGGDGTSSVVGYRGGLMAHLERLLGRRLTRVVCLNHQAELPYRALFKKLDGGTTGPFSFAGPIGRMLAGPVHQLPVAQFRPLSGAELPAVPPEVLSGLSKDLRLLVECAFAVASGDGTAVAHRQHGQVNMARWHTSQSRLLRVYMADQNPSDKLTTLAVYVVSVY